MLETNSTTPKSPVLWLAQSRECFCANKGKLQLVKGRVVQKARKSTSERKDIKYDWVNFRVHKVLRACMSCTSSWKRSGSKTPSGFLNLSLLALIQWTALKVSGCSWANRFIRSCSFVWILLSNSMIWFWAEARDLSFRLWFNCLELTLSSKDSSSLVFNGKKIL